MTITPEVYLQHTLLSDPVVAGIVGTDVYNIFVPKANTQLPFVVYRRGSSLNENTVSGRGPIGLPETNFYVSSWAEDLATSRELGDAVMNALNGSVGSLGDLSVVSILLTSEIDDFVDPVPAGAQLPLAYEVRQAYQVRWQRA